MDDQLCLFTLLYAPREQHERILADFVTPEHLKLFVEAFTPGWAVERGAPDAMVYAIWAKLDAVAHTDWPQTKRLGVDALQGGKSTLRALGERGDGEQRPAKHSRGKHVSAFHGWLLSWCVINALYLAHPVISPRF